MSELDLATRPRNGAVFDESDEYRFLLWRTWTITKPQVLFLLLYPSGHADADVDDATTSRCLQYARLWGFGGLELASLYGTRATTAKEIFQRRDPIGPSNDQHIVDAATRTRYVVCAWGASAGSKRVEQVLRTLVNIGQSDGRTVLIHHLGFAVDGQPQQIMRAPSLQAPIPWISDCDSCLVPSKHTHCGECGSYDHTTTNCDNGG